MGQSSASFLRWNLYQCWNVVCMDIFRVPRLTLVNRMRSTSERTALWTATATSSMGQTLTLRSPPKISLLFFKYIPSWMSVKVLICHYLTSVLILGQPWCIGWRSLDHWTDWQVSHHSWQTICWRSLALIPHWPRSMTLTNWDAPQVQHRRNRG